MATFFEGQINPSFLCLIFLISCSQIFIVSCTEFEVGGKDGWVVPKSNNDDYNNWASKNRFQVNDTLRFKYEKDSVMLVTEEDYNKCKSSRPFFFSNNGDTVFQFDRSGLFFFISGVSGHCARGQKMIIKVLEVEAAQPPQSENANATEPHRKGTAAPHMAAISKTTMALTVMSFLGLLSA